MDSDALRKILISSSKQPGNHTCADCSAPNPKWASTSLGIFICIKCAGAHRSLGTHISKVKSISLDSWDLDSVKRMREVGNEISNKFFLAKTVAGLEISEFSSPEDRNTFIVQKYARRMFCGRQPQQQQQQKQMQTRNTVAGDLFAGIGIKQNQNVPKREEIKHVPMKKPVAQQVKDRPNEMISRNRMVGASPWVTRKTSLPKNTEPASLADEANEQVEVDLLDFGSCESPPQTTAFDFIDSAEPETEQLQHPLEMELNPQHPQEVELKEDVTVHSSEPIDFFADLLPQEEVPVPLF